MEVGDISSYTGQGKPGMVMEIWNGNEGLGMTRWNRRQRRVKNGKEVRGRGLKLTLGVERYKRNRRGLSRSSVRRQTKGKLYTGGERHLQHGRH